MHPGIGYQGPGRYRVEFEDGMIGEVDLPTSDAFIGAVHKGVEVYVHQTDGNLGFSLKKAVKKVRKVVKKVTKPVTSVVKKATDLPGLKLVKKGVRSVAARAGALTPVGLLVQPKALGIKSASAQRAFTQTQKIGRFAVAPVAATMIRVGQKAMTATAPKGVVTESAPAMLPSAPPPQSTVFVPPTEFFEPQPSPGPVSIPGWESSGGGGGGGMPGSAEAQPVPEETPTEEKKPEEKKGGGILALLLLGVGAYYATKG